MRYEATTSIPASPSTVRSILTDTSRHPEWNSGVAEATATAALDAVLTIVNEVAPGRRFPLRVVELAPGERMVWRGVLPLGLSTVCERSGSGRARPRRTS